MTAIDVQWEGTGRERAGRGLRWSSLVWAVVRPRPGQITRPTTSGTVLIALAFGIGSAAYNAANNILFIALSLMLSCLILSGVLAWLNFRGIRWRLRPPASFRAGHETLVPLEVRNTKRVLPTYGLSFALSARPLGTQPEPKQRQSVREMLAAPGRDRARGRVFLRGRLDPEGETQVEWTFRPARRGRHEIAIESVGSLFPFGFLQKNLAAATRREILVWPAPIEFQRGAAGAAQAQPAGSRASNAGMGGDLVALRKYAPGDSHSVIHWKASARTRELLVRQFSAESHETFSLWFDAPAEVWPRPEQFEVAVQFAASLAEDLFRGGRLRSVAVGDREPAAVRRARDLDAFLDQLAVAATRPSSAAAVGPARGRNLITFAPEGARGVVARVDGRPIAGV